MKRYEVTIIKTNGVRVSKAFESKNETLAYRKAIRYWGDELKEIYNIVEIE